MNEVRLGIIGLGNMGTGHFQNIKDGSCPEFKVTAIADINPQRLEFAKSEDESIALFDNADEMINSGLCDAILVAVPHYDHPKYAIAAMKAGLHVMVEKPAGVYTKQVREMNEEAKKHDVVFGMMFNQRTNCVYKKMRELVKSGKYGAIRRTNWLITNWYRPKAYYDSGAWRASWRGEGGGVLMNQAPHQLDLMQWIFGVPNSVYANLSVAKYHNIEVEDDAELLFGYDDGSSAVFITSTGETPGTNRLEISGDKGKIVLEEGKLKHWKLHENERDFCFSKSEGFYNAPYDYSEFSADEEKDGHITVLNNFCNHILFGEPLIASGFDGVYQTQMTSSAYLSNFTFTRQPIPCEIEEFDALIKKLSEKSKKRKISKKFNEDCSDRWKVRW